MLSLRQLALLVIVIVTLVPAADSYTVEDIQTRCVCNILNDRIIHPTDCRKYFYCDNIYVWRETSCSASTFYDSAKRACLDPRGMIDERCPYDQGINENKDLSISLLPQCLNPDGPVRNGSITTGATVTGVAGSTVATPMTVRLGTTGAALVTTPEASRAPNITVVLAVLLAVAFGLLITVVIGILLYRRRQKLRRPTNFYSRKSPAYSSYGNKDTGTPPPPAGNAAYLSRSLLNNRTSDDVIQSTEEIYEMPEEPGYMEIPERRVSEDYYTDPAISIRPPMTLPGVSLHPPPADGDNEYSTAITPEEVAEEAPGADTYMHPRAVSPQDNHLYGSRRDESSGYDDMLAVDDPYDYCQPEVANPTLSFRRGTADPLPARPAPPARAHSPPYYVDPIPDSPAQDAPDQDKPPHPYHTLEPLMKKA